MPQRNPREFPCLYSMSQATPSRSFRRILAEQKSGNQPEFRIFQKCKRDLSPFAVLLFDYARKSRRQKYHPQSRPVTATPTIGSVSLIPRSDAARNGSQQRSACIAGMQYVHAAGAVGAVVFYKDCAVVERPPFAIRPAKTPPSARPAFR